MIAVDSNILVYTHRAESEWHEAADRCIAELAESGRDWAIPWSCIHEFLAVVMHPRVYEPPSPQAKALEQVECWLEAPSLVLLGESVDYWQVLKSQLKRGRITGPRVHDARVAAICLQHGIRELWSADRDFSRFKDLVVRNPLVGD
jgi:toxin-antitoxin system PIN domain toxin